MGKKDVSGKASHIRMNDKSQSVFGSFTIIYQDDPNKLGNAAKASLTFVFDSEFAGEGTTNAMICNELLCEKLSPLNIHFMSFYGSDSRYTGKTNQTFRFEKDVVKADPALLGELSSYLSSITKEELKRLKDKDVSEHQGVNINIDENNRLIAMSFWDNRHPDEPIVICEDDDGKFTKKIPGKKDQSITEEEALNYVLARVNKTQYSNGNLSVSLNGGSPEIVTFGKFNRTVMNAELAASLPIHQLEEIKDIGKTIGHKGHKLIHKLEKAEKDKVITEKEYNNFEELAAKTQAKLAKKATGEKTSPALEF